MRLRSAEVRSLLHGIRDCYAVPDRRALPSYLVARLPRVVRADTVSYTEMGTESLHFMAVKSPDAAPATSLPAFTRHMHEHPLVRLYAAGRTVRARSISDFLDRRHFHGLGLYADYYRGEGIEYQAVMPLRVGPPVIAGVAFNRQLADFSKTDRVLLDLLRPHVLQGIETGEAFERLERQARVSERTLELLGAGLVTMTAGGAWSASPTADRLLGRYFPGRRPSPGALPGPVEQWLRHVRSHLDGDTPPPPQQPLVVEQEGHRLLVRRLSGPHGETLLLEERPSAPDPLALEALGLSRREAEVLAWVARGKTNVDIAVILGVRPKTVGKHLERVFQKLGVETRTAAMAAALDRVVLH